MRNGKLYGLGALFLLLTALRLSFPVQAGQAQAWVKQAVDPGGCCRVFARSIGQELDGVGLRDGLTAVFRLGEEAFG